MCVCEVKGRGTYIYRERERGREGGREGGRREGERGSHCVKEEVSWGLTERGGRGTVCPHPRHVRRLVFSCLPSRTSSRVGEICGASFEHHATPTFTSCWYSSPLSRTRRDLVHIEIERENQAMADSTEHTHSVSLSLSLPQSTVPCAACSVRVPRAKRKPRPLFDLTC